MEDDLARFYPHHKNLEQPLELDYHSKKLISEYESRKDKINSQYDCYLGRSRVATLSSNRGDRKGCSYCGRCLWQGKTGLCWGIAQQSALFSASLLLGVIFLSPLHLAFALTSSISGRDR